MLDITDANEIGVLGYRRRPIKFKICADYAEPIFIIAV